MSVTASELVEAAVESYALDEPLRTKLIECKELEKVAQAWLSIDENFAIETAVPAMVEVLQFLSAGPDVIHLCRAWESGHKDLNDRIEQAKKILPEANLDEHLATILDGDFFTAACRPPLRVIGKRGRASDTQGAFNGAAVHQIAFLLPKSKKNDYALITALAKTVGINITRQNCRSILLRGHT